MGRAQRPVSDIFTAETQRRRGTQVKNEGGRGDGCILAGRRDLRPPRDVRIYFSLCLCVSVVKYFGSEFLTPGACEHCYPWIQYITQLPVTTINVHERKVYAAA
jgi:hypothetical protein